MPNYPQTLRWEENALVLLDQTLLPVEEKYIACRTVDDVVSAIKRLAVRGAPAIGVAAAYGVALAALADMKSVPRAIEQLAASRPTAVNLFWALDRMKEQLDAGADAAALVAEARAIDADDVARCRRLGDLGAALLPDDATIMTICNAGALATAGMGTALAVVYRAVELGKKVRVFANETRPLLQGARITAWELLKAGIDVTLITDNMAATTLRRFRIDAVITGADRIAANGDSANKIGTYGLAILARHHGVPFYIVAPFSTVDLATPSGAAIPIEERGRDEIIRQFGRQIAPDRVKVFNPAFDVTPRELISRIVTDLGVIDPNREKLASLRPK